MSLARSFVWQLLILVCAALAPLLVLLAYTTDRHLADAEANALNSVRNRSLQVAEQATLVVTRARAFLAFLAERPEVVALDKQRCDDLLGRMVTIDPLWANIVVVGHDGTRVCASLYGPGPVPDSYAAFPWFRQAMSSDGFIVSKPFLAASEQVPVAVATLPLRDASGRRIGGVGLSLDRSQWQAQWKHLDLPPASIVALIDGEGAVLAQMPEDGERLPPTLLAALRPAREAAGTPASVRATAQGVERVYAATALSERGWTAVVGAPTEHVLATARAERLRNLLAVAAAVTLAIGLAAFIARRLLQSLRGLARTARAAASGQRNARAPGSPVSELDEVAVEFNRMLDVREQTEASLAEAQRRYSDMLDNVDFLALMVGLDGTVNYCNDHLLRVTGWLRHEVIGRDWLELLAPRGAGTHGNLLDDALRALELPRHFEHSVATRYGERRIVQWSSSTLRAADGARQGVALMGQDVTARREAERREARLAGFYAALSRTNQMVLREREPAALYEGVCRICVETGHAAMACVVLDGGDHGELAGAAGPASELFPAPAQGGAAGIGLQGVLLGLVLQRGRHCISNSLDELERPAYEHLRAHGVAALAALPIRRGGRITGALCLFVGELDFFDAPLVALLDELAGDLSFALEHADQEAARVRAQQAAETGYANFQRIFDAIPSLALVTRLGDWQVAEINAAGCALYGLTRQQAIGARLTDLGVGMSDADRMRFYGLVMRHGSVRDFEVSSRTRHAEPRTLLLNGERIEFNGRDCLLTIGSDITELRQAEHARQARAAAEAANQAKTEFLSRMSHELRTPLNAMLGFVLLLLSDADEQLSPRQRSDLQRVLDAGQHLLALVEDVLDVARIEVGRLTVTTGAVALPPVLESALEMVAESARQRGVHIEAGHGAEPGMAVIADALRLRQVVCNLLSNAIKYNRPGGRVRLRACRAGEQVGIVVEDDGPGMSAEQLSHAFEPFNRLGRERGPVEGTGIGLALSNQLVRLMGGSIAIDSTPGQGCRVTVTLDAADSSVPPDEPAQGHAEAPFEQLVRGPAEAPRRDMANGPPLPAPAGTEPLGTVLCVDDEPTNLMLLDRYLARFPGLSVVQASTGTAAIEQALRLLPDLVLLDMQLPDLDGAEVLRRLRAEPATRALPIVVVSASAMPDEIAHARQAGATDYWTKPLDFAAIEPQLRRLLQRRAPRR